MTSERTLKMVLEYDGSAYQGWQVQPHAPTIQGEIEARLEQILGQSHRVHGAGRTDAGVHARGQVAHFRTERPIAPEVLHRALNATLPRDIAVTSVLEVSPGFHARKQAHRKLYAYQILNRPQRSVFLERYAWHLVQPLAWGEIASVCSQLIGEHDFSAFRASDCGARTTVRQVFDCRVVMGAEGLYRIEIEGNGFLKHMVRNLVGTMVEVGQGKRTVGDFARILVGRDRRRAGKTAPAKGLFLEWVAYDAEGAGGRSEEPDQS